MANPKNLWVSNPKNVPHKGFILATTKRSPSRGTVKTGKETVEPDGNKPNFKALCNARDKTQMAADLSFCNRSLRLAAESHAKQKKEVDAMKNEVNRLKRCKTCPRTLSKSEEAYKEAQRVLVASSKKFATAYNILQASADAAYTMSYRKEYKDAKKSLAEFEGCTRSLRQHLEQQQSADHGEKQKEQLTAQSTGIQQQQSNSSSKIGIRNLLTEILDHTTFADGAKQELAKPGADKPAEEGSDDDDIDEEVSEMYIGTELDSVKEETDPND